MGLSKHYDQLKDLLDDQICKILKKGDITPQELDSLYKASAIILDLETEKAMKEAQEKGEHEYSQRMSRRMSYTDGQSNHYPWFMYYNDGTYHPGNSYGYQHAYDGAYNGAYDASMDSDYSGRRGRDQRTGRYISRDTERERMIGRLEEMMEDAPSEKERRALQQCVNKLEQQ